MKSFFKLLFLLAFFLFINYCIIPKASALLPSDEEDLTPTFIDKYKNLCRNDENSFDGTSQERLDKLDQQCLGEWKLPKEPLIFYLLGIGNENVTSPETHYKEIHRINLEFCPDWLSRRKCALGFFKRRLLRCPIEKQDSPYEKEPLNFYFFFAFNDAFCFGMKLNKMEKFFQHGGSKCFTEGVGPNYEFNTRRGPPGPRPPTPVLITKMTDCVQTFTIKTGKDLARWIPTHGRNCLINSLDHCSKETVELLNPIMDLIALGFRKVDNAIQGGHNTNTNTDF